MAEHTHTNNLIHETSPYLLQHAHNPVNWFAWGDEALQKAKQEDKPILVSIGYSACHWCHVMERESFEDETTAQLMNEHFINIKIDREERPDIDHIYMDAVQAITGSGGWPLNVFLTPDLKPFYGGTYYPPVRAFNRSSWSEVLVAVANSFKEKRNEITAQAENLTQHLLNANSFGNNDTLVSADKNSTNTIAENLIKLADKEWGGFGQAPKFPQTFSILFLLRHYHLTGDENALTTALLSLDKMMMGGIYDHLGGGFCRYSTDARWQIPHFEKMLYDNALLLDAFAEAYQLTKKEVYAKIIRQTIEFIQREMMSPEGGFYSALDADSEGVEGKYYTWSKEEIDLLLGDRSAIYCQAYNISQAGNWEHTNIIWLPKTLEKVAEKLKIDQAELIQQLDVANNILFNERQKRIRPALDNKVLCGWNALIIASLCKVYDAFGDSAYLELAETNIQFIEKYLFHNNNLLHSWNIKPNLQEGFLDDYASLIRAYISLHQSTTNENYLLKGKALTEKVIDKFGDENSNLFYFTAKEQKDVLIRKVETYDGATPSGNSLMAGNLLPLSIYFDKPEWKAHAEKMIFSVYKLAEKYPTTFGGWSLHFQSIIYGLKEIAVIGETYKEVLKQILEDYIPLKIIQGSATSNNTWPLLMQKIISVKETKIYICENYSCRTPLNSYKEFKNQLANIFNKKSWNTK